MDLQTRKIEFVQEFLKLQSEETVSLLENVLKMEIDVNDTPAFEPMSIIELNARIDRSEEDFKDGKFKSSAEILSKYK